MSFIQMSFYHFSDYHSLRWGSSIGGCMSIIQHTDNYIFLTGHLLEEL